MAMRVKFIVVSFLTDDPSPTLRSTPRANPATGTQLTFLVDRRIENGAGGRSMCTGESSATERAMFRPETMNRWALLYTSAEREGAAIPDVLTENSKWVLPGFRG
jgi:hypothetical protein